jgi:ATP-dependent Clp protease ATP-binding subunit ClpA
MFTRFTKDARRIVTEATAIARERGSSSVEAEHLLLAAASGTTPVAGVLHNAGLDVDGLLAALEAETARSLAAVGVRADPPRFSPYVESPRFAASSKLALERALRVAVARKDNHIGSEHIVLAVLRATTGTVPRALECADVDRIELMGRVQAR